MLDNNSTARAMALMIAAMLMLPGIDAIAKWLAGSVSSGQVTWSRFFFQVIFMSPLLWLTRGPWWTPALPLHAARGALIIIRPTFADVGYAALLPVGAATCFSFYILLTRKLVANDDPIRLQFFAGIFGCLVMSAGLAWGTASDVEILTAAWPSTTQWLLLGALGLIAATCHLLVVYAYRAASIGILAPFQYIEIIAATILGLVIFGDFPDAPTWLGIAIIVGSGIYVFRREARLAAQHKIDELSDPSAPDGTLATRSTPKFGSDQN